MNKITKNMDVLEEVLVELEVRRRNPKYEKSPDADHAYRMCTAVIAEKLGYTDRAEWVQNYATEIVRYQQWYREKTG